jgi:hypothetical protein
MGKCGSVCGELTRHCEVGEEQLGVSLVKDLALSLIKGGQVWSIDHIIFGLHHWFSLQMETRGGSAWVAVAWKFLWWNDASSDRVGFLRIRTASDDMASIQDSYLVTFLFIVPVELKYMFE